MVCAKKQPIWQKGILWKVWVYLGQSTFASCQEHDGRHLKENDESCSPAIGLLRPDNDAAALFTLATLFHNNCVIRAAARKGPHSFSFNSAASETAQWREKQIASMARWSFLEEDLSTKGCTLDGMLMQVIVLFARHLGTCLDVRYEHRILRKKELGGKTDRRMHID